MAQMKSGSYPWSIAGRKPEYHREGEKHLVKGHGTPVKRTNTYEIDTATQPTQTHSMAIDEDALDLSYFSAVKIGSSGKIMYMLIDTGKLLADASRKNDLNNYNSELGAANTWIMGSNCTTKACASHNTFGNADSSTFRATQTPFNLTYGTGSVSGVIVNDTMQVAGITILLSFGLASNTSSDFSAYPMDGILGLGRPQSNDMDVPTVMEAVESAKVLQANLFGVNLQRNSDGNANGELNFGAPDTKRFIGNLSYSDTVSDGPLWEIAIEDIGVNGVSCNFTGKSAIVDTGTSFVLMPPADAQLLHAQIPQSQQDGDVFNVPCTSTLPIHITVMGVSYNISSKDYLGSRVGNGDLCSSNIIGRQTFGPNQWLLGDVFLKNVYTVFDFDNSRLGKLELF